MQALVFCFITTAAFTRMMLNVVYCAFECLIHLVSAAPEDHPDSRFPKQKEPTSEDQTSGAEETGAGRLHPGSTSASCSRCVAYSNTVTVGCLSHN